MSRLFEPYRALGYVSAPDVPVCVETSGTESFVVTSIGTTFHIYSLSSLKLLFVGSPHLRSDIRLLEARDPYVFAVCKSDPGVVHVFRRGRLVDSFDVQTAVSGLLPMGNVLVASCFDGSVTTFLFKRSAAASASKVLTSSRCIEASALRGPLCHPQTYLNKILVGPHLVNINSGAVIHQFAALASTTARMSVCEPSPAVDVVAFGFDDGVVRIHNVKRDQPLFELRHSAAVVCISFRTDGEPVIGVVCGDGCAYFWDLEKRSLVFKSPRVHALASGKFVPRESLFVTTSSRNCLAVWVFDQSDGSARILRQRSGHSETVSLARWYNESMILSSSTDGSFRFSAVRNDADSGTFSSKDLELEPVTSFAWSSTRSRDWADVASLHPGPYCVNLWRTETRSLADATISLPVSKPLAAATCCAVSACGNFLFVGLRNGRLCRFNMQSGLLREEYASPSSASAAAGAAADGSVVAVLPDVKNRFVLAAYSGGCVCQFPSGVSVSLGTGICCGRMHPSGLCVFGLDNRTICIVSELAVVRILATPHSSRISDACFSRDGRRIVSAGADGSVAVYDVVNARCIDAFRLPLPITSCDFDPSGAFWTTTHADCPVICLWSNRSMYDDVAFKPVDSFENLPLQRLPVSTGRAIESVGDLTGTADNGDDLVAEEADGMVLPSALDEESTSLVRLAGAPRPLWATLGDLDSIRQRNKPRLPVVRSAAPFLLQLAADPKAAGVAAHPEMANGGDLLSETDLADAAPSAEASAFGIATRLLMDREIPVTVSELSRLLLSQRYQSAAEHLRSSSASALDAEIRSLSGKPLLVAWVQFFISRIALRTDFELLQGLLKLFLDVHLDGLVALEDKDADDMLTSLLAVQKGSWLALDDMFNRSLCMTRFFFAPT